MMNAMEMMMKQLMSNFMGGISFDKLKADAEGLYQRFIDMERKVANLTGEGVTMVESGVLSVSERLDRLELAIINLSDRMGSGVTEERLHAWELKMEDALKHFGFDDESQAKEAAAVSETPELAVVTAQTQPDNGTP